ncbi:MAG: hypothetical protein AAF495_09890 [Pseudomonadota bacterium]
MNANTQSTSDATNSAMMRARQARADALAAAAKTAKRRAQHAATRPAAEPRKLAKCAIKPIGDQNSRNRTTTNPLILRGLAIS